MTFALVIFSLLLLSLSLFRIFRRYRRSLLVLAFLILAWIPMLQIATADHRSGTEATLLFFGFLAWFRLAGEFDSRDRRDS